MKMKILKIQVLILVSLYICTGCFFPNNEKWIKLTDRKFYFTEFQFILLGQSKEDAFNFFQKFPVKKIMFMMASEFNITIDISEFNDFLKTKKSENIESDGLLRTVKNTWRAGKSGHNRITYIFNQDYMDETKLKFKILIFSENSSIQTFDMEIDTIESIFDTFKYYLKSGKESLNEYDEKKYNNISPIPFILESKEGSPETDTRDDMTKIKTMIDNYIKPLDQKEKNIFKHDIIDYIYQKCN